MTINRWKAHIMSWYYRMQMVLLLFFNYSSTILQLFFNFSSTILQLFLNFSWTFLKLIKLWTAQLSISYARANDTLLYCRSNTTCNLTDHWTLTRVLKYINVWIIQWMNQWWISYYHIICNFKRILCLQMYGNMFCKKYSLWIF